MKFNKKLFTSIAVLIVVMLLAGMLISCNDNTPDVPDETTTAPADETTAEPLSENIVFFENGEKKISRVVRSQNSESGSADIESGISIRDSFNNIVQDTFNITLSYDQQIKMDEDWIIPGTSYDQDSIEILVGCTAYEQTASVMKDMSYGEYCIKLVGNKIVVAAYAPDAFKKAAEELDLLMRKYADSETRTISIPKSEFNKRDVVAISLDSLPHYEGGQLGLYYKATDDVDEIIVTKTNADEYETYLKKVEGAGFKRYTQNKVNGSIFTTYTNDKYTVTVGYYDYEKSSRILIEPLAAPVGLESDNKYTKITTSQVTMIGLEYKNAVSYTSNGMSMLIRLEDGRFIVVDGGFNRAASANNLIKQLREQSKDYAKTDSDIVIAAWIITHPHIDHDGMISGQHGAFTKFKVENLLVNFMSEEERSKAMASKQYSKNYSESEGVTTKIYNAAKQLKATVRTVHVGEVHYYANAKLEVLYTMEVYGPKLCNALNTTSLVIKATINDTVFMITGDATGDGLEIAAKIFGDYLKSDIVQLSHHGSITWGNDAGAIRAYDLMRPTTVLWPAGGHAYPDYTSKGYNAVLINKKSNPNYAETYVAGSEGDFVILPLPYTVGSGIVIRGSESNLQGPSTVINQ